MFFALKSKIAKGALAGAVASAALTVVTFNGAVGQSSTIVGSWSGGGQIVFPSGESERARCRAKFRSNGGRSYGMNAVCATASARVSQYAEIYHLTGNRYRGEFNNTEYGISGSIRIEVNGNSMDASLSGGGGSAEFSLSR